MTLVVVSERLGPLGPADILAGRLPASVVNPDVLASPVLRADGLEPARG